MWSFLPSSFRDDVDSVCNAFAYARNKKKNKIKKENTPQEASACVRYKGLDQRYITQRENNFLLGGIKKKKKKKPLVEEPSRRQVKESRFLMHRASAMLGFSARRRRPAINEDVDGMSESEALSPPEISANPARSEIKIAR
ncbi:hypothetical protein PUN28_006558 [Cardiocondyla obscurior]|uniref:Uncharacterized protein n=1 Tax=Cardiocondyla obscurior TaxID=286306 RepID=A0AAW2GB83_9HYME